MAAVAGDRYLWVSGPGQGIAVVDLVERRVRAVGRVGEGPGEFRAVAAVFGCADRAAFVDQQLLRLTMMSPPGDRVLGAPIRLPAGLGGGRITSAWCNGSLVTMAVETRTPATTSRVASTRDSLLVMRWDLRTPKRVDTIMRVAATRRELRSKGALRFSLRVPYTEAPTAVPIREGLALLSRETDTVRVLASGATPRAFLLRAPATASRALSPATQQLVIDSLRQAVEDEMAGQQHPPDLRREFRRLREDAERSVRLPTRLPTVWLATADAAPGSLALVAEHGTPGSTRRCVSRVLATGAMERLFCRDFGAARLTALASVGGRPILLLATEDAAWVEVVRR